MTINAAEENRSQRLYWAASQTAPRNKDQRAGASSPARLYPYARKPAASRMLMVNADLAGVILCMDQIVLWKFSACYTAAMKSDRDKVLHPQALEGLHLFNAGQFFEAHEALETAWREEENGIRNLYQGILQVAVSYLHITRGNYSGALKVYERSRMKLKDFPAVCRGIHVAELMLDAEHVMNELSGSGAAGIHEFDPSFFKPIIFD